MTDLLSRANVDIAINTLLDDLQPNDAIQPSDHNGLLGSILDTLANGLSTTLRTANTTGGFDIDITDGDNIKYNKGGSFVGVLDSLTLTGSRSWDFPDNSGTIALLSDITGGDNISSANLTFDGSHYADLSSFSWTLGGVAPIGLEKISLQKDTLIKGSDNSASTSGFKVTDVNDLSLLDIKNNGVTTFGKYTTPLTGNYLSKHFIGNSGRGSNNTLNYSDFVFEDQNGVTMALFSDALKSNVISCHDGTAKSFIEFKGSNESMNFYNRGSYWLSTYQNSHTVYGKNYSNTTNIIKDTTDVNIGHIFNGGDLQMFTSDETINGNVNISKDILFRSAYKTVGGVQANNNIKIGTNADNIGNYSLVIKDNGNSNLFQVKSNGQINASNLPTSSAGLVSGDIWNNSGVLNIV